MATQTKEQPPKAGQAAPDKPKNPPPEQPGAKIPEGDRLIEFKAFNSDIDIKLSINLVLRFFCKPTKNGVKCSAEQAFKFIMLCLARKLNPWEGDAFLVGYDTKDGPEFNLITAHQAFAKRAEDHPQFNGMDSGVIVARPTPLLDKDGNVKFDQNGKPIIVMVNVELDGDFFNGDDILVGAWAKVYRKDRPKPVYRRIKLASFDKGFGRWNHDKGGMIVKCAEADAFRSAFPNINAGLYIEGEIQEDHEIAKTTLQERAANYMAPPTPGPAAVENGAMMQSFIPTEPAKEPEKVPATTTGDTEQGKQATYQQPEPENKSKATQQERDEDPYANGEIPSGDGTGTLFGSTMTQEQMDAMKG